tara:strand:- start:32802 stop:34094 length:1293 start_codon:yes stop_codon:yes gene_type:complete
MNMSVQPFKKGPDYIDPMWMSAASGKECRSLDFHMMGDENILRSFQSVGRNSDISIIEGNQGLFDGMDIDGYDCTAGLAQLLDSPVVLVINTLGMNRSVAPLLQGYNGFDKEIKIAGVILNMVSNPRHEKKLVDAIDKFVGMEILGVVPKAPQEVKVNERHLGLIPLKEDPELFIKKVIAIGELIKKSVNIDRLVEISKEASELPILEPCPTASGSSDIKIGIAMDRAFTFYYPENLEALVAAGAELIPFSPIDDTSLPNVDGLYIGGGFPEVFIEKLDNNVQIRSEIKSAIENGMPTYAECGGLVYLTNSLAWKNRFGKMVGVLDCGVEIAEKPVGLGYMNLESTGNCKWFSPNEPVKCHEFHHSRIVDLKQDYPFAWKITRGTGITGTRDGFIYKNLMASFAHLHSCGAPSWAENFTDLIRTTKLSSK